MQRPTLSFAIDRNQHDKFFNDIERSADRYLANNWQIKRALPARQTTASRVSSFTIHNIPEFSRKLTYFLSSF